MHAVGITRPTRPLCAIICHDFFPVTNFGPPHYRKFFIYLKRLSVQALKVEKFSHPWIVKYGVGQQRDYSVLNPFEIINYDKF